MPNTHARRPFLWSLLLALLIAAPEISKAGPFDPSGGEYQKKAEFLCKFALFVTWPAKKFAQPDSPFVVGVFGSDPISDYLREAIQDRRIKDRPVMIRSLQFKEELAGCHMLFISRSEKERLGSILGAVKRENVLTIGETDNFIGRGGVINFVNLNGKISFQINSENAERERLKIDSRLMNLSLRGNIDAVAAAR